jgi:hypothetical protein
MKGKEILAIAIAIVVFAVMGYFALGFIIISAPGETRVIVGPRSIETIEPGVVR